MLTLSVSTQIQKGNDFCHFCLMSITTSKNLWGGTVSVPLLKSEFPKFAQWQQSSRECTKNMGFQVLYLDLLNYNIQEKDLGKYLRCLIINKFN